MAVSLASVSITRAPSTTVSTIPSHLPWESLMASQLTTSCLHLSLTRQNFIVSVKNQSRPIWSLVMVAISGSISTASVSRRRTTMRQKISSSFALTATKSRRRIKKVEKYRKQPHWPKVVLASKPKKRNKLNRKRILSLIKNLKFLHKIRLTTIFPKDKTQKSLMRWIWLRRRSWFFLKRVHSFKICLMNSAASPWFPNS